MRPRSVLPRSSASQGGSPWTDEGVLDGLPRRLLPDDVVPQLFGLANVRPARGRRRDAAQHLRERDLPSQQRRPRSHRAGPPAGYHTRQEIASELGSPPWLPATAGWPRPAPRRASPSTGAGAPYSATARPRMCRRCSATDPAATWRRGGSAGSLASTSPFCSRYGAHRPTRHRRSDPAHGRRPLRRRPGGASPDRPNGRRADRQRLVVMRLGSVLHQRRRGGPPPEMMMTADSYTSACQRGHEPPDGLSGLGRVTDRRHRARPVVADFVRSSCLPTRYVSSTEPQRSGGLTESGVAGWTGDLRQNAGCGNHVLPQ
jgi:hypothetical protein